MHFNAVLNTYFYIMEQIKPIYTFWKFVTSIFHLIHRLFKVLSPCFATEYTEYIEIILLLNILKNRGLKLRALSVLCGCSNS